jgi:uncharacterized protein (DUF4415 family)
MTAKSKVKQGYRGASKVKARKRRAKLHGAAEKNAPGWLELYKPLKKSVTLRLDADVLAWFKHEGRGYQTRINRALRDVMVRGRKNAK